MATTTAQMPSKNAAKAAPVAAPAVSDQDLHAAFKLRGERILQGFETQVSNTEKLLRTKKARPSDKQKEAFRSALKTIRDRIDAALNDKPVQRVGGIPDE